MNKFQDYNQLMRYIENNYEEEDQLIIEDFMSYYINGFRGFGHRNCERTYQDNLQRDETGELHKLALIGFDFEKSIKKTKA